MCSWIGSVGVSLLWIGASRLVYLVGSLDGLLVVRIPRLGRFLDGSRGAAHEDRAVRNQVR